MKKEHIYQHFRKEEMRFIDQVQEWIEQSLYQYTPVLTVFLQPREQHIVQNIVGQYADIDVYFWGGYEQSERKRAIFFPSMFVSNEKQNEFFELCLMEIEYPVKFSTLQHRSILGSLMGLGIEREVLGDIVTDGVRWQFFCTKPISNYIKQNLSKIGAIAVKVKEQSIDDLITPLEEYQKKDIVVSSMRLDTIIASALTISRQKAKQLVESGAVQVNYAVVEKQDFDIQTSDLISVRKYGRFRIEEYLGNTKKDKIRLNLTTVLAK